MHKTSGNTALGIILAVTTAFLWGILPVFLKQLLGSMDAYTITWYRFFSAAIILTLFLAKKQQLPNPLTLPNKGRILMAVAGFGLCSNYIFYLLGLDYISAETVQVVIQAAPFLMMLGGVIVFKEAFNRIQILGSVILVTSLLLFFNERLILFIQPGNNYGPGVFWVFTGAVTWALYALAQKQLLMRFNSMQIMLLIYALGTILFSPLAQPSQVFALNPVGLICLLLCCLNTLIAYGAFAEALAHWEASRVSAVLAITPLITILSVHVFAYLWPVFAAPDELNWLAYTGALGVVAGSAVTALAKNNAKKPAPAEQIDQMESKL